MTKETKGLTDYCYGTTPNGVIMKWHRKSYIPLDVWFDPEDKTFERAEELAGMLWQGQALPENLMMIQSNFRE